MSGLVQQSCSEGLLQNEEEAETLQCSWGGTVDTDQSRALSSPTLRTQLGIKLCSPASAALVQLGLPAPSGVFRGKDNEGKAASDETSTRSPRRTRNTGHKDRKLSYTMLPLKPC
ncbi:hypothetical protein KOW79_018552 [Hemibagrus wyckioides]|uniref:Uncharacterized protein n=1 Tax=Hemibagrus wyckioides TaxID=337641 RepID=A0A9D3N8C7_9TELE|nr:hypothetical protein KOW79_018552 [Hemibagrus wyckioides]